MPFSYLKAADFVFSFDSNHDTINNDYAVYGGVSLDTRRQVMQINSLVLAFVGDAVQEQVIKTHLARTIDASSHVLQRHSVAYLCCEAQAMAARAIFDELTEEEQAVYKRARNAKVSTVPKHATVNDYHAATGIEAVIGFCHLTGDNARAEWIVGRMREVCDEKTKKKEENND